MTRYVPILKGKQGEYSGLQHLAPRTRAEIQPLVELVPSGDVDDADVQQNDARKAQDKLGRAWTLSTLFLDAGNYDLDTDLGGFGLTAYACQLLEDRSVYSVPVARLSDPPLVRTDIATVNGKFGRGACIRLTGDDLQEDGDVIEAMIDDFVAATTLRRAELDLLLDAGPVDGDVAAQLAARSIRSLLREMDQIDDYRSVTVAAGAFPQDLSEFAPNVLGTRPRYDADMWGRLASRWSGRALDYGDYAIAHPLLSDGVAFAPAPQLRYTAGTTWLVLKGRRNDPAGHSQFYAICDRIASHPEFAGAALGSADRRIANSRAEGTGNAATWRQIGTTHHLDLIVRRLTTLGEP